MPPAVALTTVDNPYDPFTQWDEWYAFDTMHGYGTCSYLARVAKTSDQLTPMENYRIIENAIDEIINLDFLHLYKKVYEMKA